VPSLWLQPQSRRRSRRIGTTARPNTVIEVMQDLLAANDRVAVHNRSTSTNTGTRHQSHVFAGCGQNGVVGSYDSHAPRPLSHRRHRGDLETDNDAVRIRALGVPALQITTGTACHLDAQLVHRALHDLPLSGLDLLFIENVGNLVCPASFDLGQHRNVTLLSVTEGDDKPEKYRSCSALPIWWC